MGKRLCIKSSETDAVEQSFDVSDKSDRQIDRLEAGIHINLDHDRFYIDIEED